MDGSNNSINQALPIRRKNNTSALAINSRRLKRIENGESNPESHVFYENI